MGTIETLGPADRAKLLEVASRLKHDLGKYICFQQRWVSGEASEAERLEALRADLLHTRRGPDGSVDAATVWADFEHALAPHAQDVDVCAIAVAMDFLRGEIVSLRAGPIAIAPAEVACAAVSSSIRSLVTRLRS